MILQKKTYFVFIFLLFSRFLFSQEIKRGDAYTYARKIVDTLASNSMHGRGYVNGGDSIAANYIKNEYESFGLRTFGEGDYYQRLSFAVNTFPGKEFFWMYDAYNCSPDITDWIAGKDYLIGGASGNISCDLSTVIFDSMYANDEITFNKFKKKDLKREFIIVDERKIKDKNKKAFYTKVKDNYFNAEGIIEVVDKLTWEPSQKVNQYPTIQILSEPRYYPTGYEGTVEIENKFIPNHPSQNIIGYVKGSVYPDSFIVFTAHYDHLGQMGKDVYFPGANDNASGCAMLLNLAKHYSLPENKPKCSVAFIAFCGEEVGLIGSKYYVEHPLFPLAQIKFLLNMDIMGTGEEGITVVNGTIFKKEFDKLKEINTENSFIKDVKIRGKAANSDHYYFSEAGVHACFIYTMGGIKAYHDIYDRAETLPLNEFQNLFQLITKFGMYLQE